MDDHSIDAVLPPSEAEILAVLRRSQAEIAGGQASPLAPVLATIRAMADDLRAKQSKAS